MNTSLDHITLNIPNWTPGYSSYKRKPEVSNNNMAHIHTILSFKSLEDDWDSYNAKKPSGAAITKAINFIVGDLSASGKEVFFSAPTPDGDILIEVKNGDSNLEFIFSGEVDDKVIACQKGEFMQEAPLTETTFNAYTNWL